MLPSGGKDEEARTSSKYLGVFFADSFSQQGWGCSKAVRLRQITPTRHIAEITSTGEGQACGVGDALCRNRFGGPWHLSRELLFGNIVGRGGRLSHT